MVEPAATIEALKMANIQVYRDEADGDLFPRVCMRCGAEAQHDVRQTFAWMPPWVNVLIFVGLAPWLLCALILRKTMRVEAPMCDRHKNHWRNRKLLIWLGLLFFVTFFITTAVLYDQIPKDAQTPVIAFGVFGGLFWLLLAMILMNRAIRAGEITNEWIELVHVHKRFRDEWEKVQPEPLPVVRRKRRRPPPREEDEEYDDRDDR